MRSFNILDLFRKHRPSYPQNFAPNIKILLNRNEIPVATSKLHKIGLAGHHDIQKNWDLSLTIDVLNAIPKYARVLDAGSGSKAVFGNSSYDLGYKNIFASDLQNYSGSNIRFTREDISHTKYPDSFFDLVGCLSVIEHGIDLDKFLQEMYRITKKNGFLCISTDYWPVEEDHSDKFPYGNDNPPMMLFNNVSLRNFIDKAENIGWSIPKFEGIDSFDPRPIEWPRMKAEYTFAWVCFVK
jgi:SAM-dependent methyltransferase